MARVKYTKEMDPEVTSRAMLYEVHISPKHVREICRELKGKRVTKAKEYLEEVINLRSPVPFKRYNRDVGHKKGKVGPGRYPQKAASEILRLIESAQSNAEYKGLESERMKIAHMTTHRGRVIEGMMPRAFGRATPKNTETTTVEVILESWS
ncbi:MAG: 50S ribosomal protein L22 [Halobacteriota archaeon]|nr:50S ribosomal protein L22 [Halobacteriota archaeon]